MLSKASSIKKVCYACQWLDNVDMHTYANFDQNIPCGSRVMSIFTNWYLTDGQIHTVIKVYTYRSCNILLLAIRLKVQSQHVGITMFRVVQVFIFVNAVDFHLKCYKSIPMKIKASVFIFSLETKSI